ncbi:MAG TPA: hypothetical protein VMA37_01140 [Acetobacteraceae bacterium]|nr:hypothetical protein [Acetobacteraceae bacterium]
MRETLYAAVVFLLLLVGAAAGMLVKGRISERHQSRETLELVSLAITMLVTFAALVMSLLIYSVKGSFDQANTDMAALAAEIVQTDQCLRNYGPETEGARAALRDYTAAVIATTWPSQPKPAAVGALAGLRPISQGAMESVVLGDIVNEIGLRIRRLEAADAYHRGIADSCLADFHDFVQARWAVNEEARSTISLPFFIVLVFWLMVIFVCFGLNAPRTTFVFMTIALCALSISSAVYVMLDIDTPFSGVIRISSQPMRNAYSDITRPYVMSDTR